MTKVSDLIVTLISYIADLNWQHESNNNYVRVKSNKYTTICESGYEHWADQSATNDFISAPAPTPSNQTNQRY